MNKIIFGIMLISSGFTFAKLPERDSGTLIQADEIRSLLTNKHSELQDQSCLSNAFQNVEHQFEISQGNTLTSVDYKRKDIIPFIPGVDVFAIKFSYKNGKTTKDPVVYCQLKQN